MEKEVGAGGPLGDPTEGQELGFLIPVTNIYFSEKE
jgi:hypothetical protein